VFSKVQIYFSLPVSSSRFWTPTFYCFFLFTNHFITKLQSLHTLIWDFAQFFRALVVFDKGNSQEQVRYFLVLQYSHPGPTAGNETSEMSHVTEAGFLLLANPNKNTLTFSLKTLSQ